jgi:hypothetical protein
MKLIMIEYASNWRNSTALLLLLPIPLRIRICIRFVSYDTYAQTFSISGTTVTQEGLKKMWLLETVTLFVIVESLLLLTVAYYLLPHKARIARTP